MQISLVTPSKEFLSDNVEIATIPGILGEFGVMNGHTPFLSTIRTGAIKLRIGDKVRRIFISHGYAEITNDKCIIIAEDLEDMANLTSNDINSDIDKIEFDLKHTKDNFKKKLFSKKLHILKKKLELL